MFLPSSPNGSNFEFLDLPKLKSIMKQPVIADLRNNYRPDEMIEHGFICEIVGRASIWRLDA
jgi:UDPglucose 6-dehydrogenase